MALEGLGLGLGLGGGVDGAEGVRLGRSHGGERAEPSITF